MANQDLLNQFFELLADSPNFKYLPKEEQEEIKKKYADASDKQVQQGIDIVKSDTKTTLEEEKAKADAALKAEQERHQKAIEERKRNEELERQESERKSQEILDQLRNL